MVGVSRSERKGRIVVPVWNNDGIITGYIDTDGYAPVRIAASDVELKVDIDACSVTLPVEEQTPLTDIQARMYHYTGSDWYKQPCIWSYSDVWQEREDGTCDASGNWCGNTGLVPAGYVYKVEYAFIRNLSSSGGTLSIILFGDATIYLARMSGYSRYDIISICCKLTLNAGQYIQFLSQGAGNGDSIVSGVAGYKMKVNE